MRVLVLGGAGEVGGEVASDLSTCPEIDELVIADLDGKRARNIVAQLPHADGRSPSAIGLDVRDRRRALEVVSGVDLLMNCTSFELFDDVIDLALRAGVNYADLISEPTELQRRAAEQAQITAISGLGASPGLSNVLVRHAAEELDELHEVHISWVSFRTVAPTPGLLDTILWELSEDCDTRQYFQDGRFERAASLDGSRLVPFASPVGPQRVYYVPHTEVTSLPRHFPTLRCCAVRGSWRPELMEDMRVLQRYGLLSAAKLESTKRTIWERFGGQRDSAPCLLYVNVEIIGSRDGQVVRRTYDASHPLDWGQTGVARMTGITAGVGAQLLVRHGRIASGFVDPEVYYDPYEFLEELGRRRAINVGWKEHEVSGLGSRAVQIGTQRSE